jgi:hypothetical protein
MPCLAASRVISTGSGAPSSAPTARTKASKPSRGDHQVARTALAHAERVRDARRGEEELPGAQRVRLVADPEGDLTVEDEPALAFLAVDVQRRLATGRGVDLEQREASGVGARGVDAGAAVEELDLFCHVMCSVAIA